MLSPISVFILFLTFNSFGYGQQEAEIYNLVVTDFAIEKNLKPTESITEVTIVALDKPSRIFKEVTFSKLKESYRKLSKEVFNDFYIKNQNDFKLQEFYSSNFELIILSKDSILSYEQMADKFPNWNHVIIELSNIGFNKRKNEAMVYFGQHFGSRSGGGIFIIYKLKKGKWNQKKIIPSWSS